MFCIGANDQGWRMVWGQERRHQGIIHSVLYFLVPGKGLFKLPNLPDAMVFSTVEGQEGTKFSGGGLLSEPKEAMKRWKLSYKGDLLHNGQTIKGCSFEGEFVSQLGYFDYDTDISIRAIARSIATEPWSRAYFKHLETYVVFFRSFNFPVIIFLFDFRAHQSRIEQMGKMRGKLIIGPDSNYEINLEAFRDLSYGHARNWELMHRYAYFMFFLDDGSRFSIIHVNQPCTGSK